LVNRNKYKIYISALLLAVYFFIAAPTQLWHQHDAVAADMKAPGKQTSLSQLPSASVDNDCQVCSHQYPAYIDYAVLLFAAPVFSELSTQDFPFLSISSQPAFNLINKGPPALL